MAELKRSGVAEARETGGNVSVPGVEKLPDIPRLKKLREDVLATRYRLCTQKAFLMTDYLSGRWKLNSLLKPVAKYHYDFFRQSVEGISCKKPQKQWKLQLNNLLNGVYMKSENISTADACIEYAKVLRYVLENMELKVYDGELIVGNPSEARVGAPIHPDLGGLMMMPEIEGLDRRARNPMETSEHQKKELMERVFPYWFNRSVVARMPFYSGNGELVNVLGDGRYFVLTQFAGVSHVTPDYQSVLKFGFKGIKDKIVAKQQEASDELKRMSGNGSAPGERMRAKDKLAFYDAALITAEAAIEYGRRWNAHLLGLAGAEQDGLRKQELLEMAAIFERVPAEPARSFREALQSIFTTHTILHQESFQHGISYGRMDQYLYPYYRKDIDEGRLTREQAAELYGCFLVKAGELVPLFFEMATEYFSGLSSASGIALGGMATGGGDGVNELSYLMLQAYDQVRLRQPNFHVRITEDTPSSFIDLCSETLKKGGGIPAFFNDHAVIPAMVESGISEEDAREYAIVGCVEWGVQGKSFPAAGAVFVNLAMALHLALHDGVVDGEQFGPRTGEPGEMKSMEDILVAFRAQLKHMVGMAVEGNNAIEKAHALHRPTPCLSTVVDGCIDKGLEVNAGGAVYNSTGCQGVGLADVVDSLAAIEKVVFDEKKYSLAEFIKIVDGGFKADAALRSHIVNRCPKYCRNSKEADKFATEVSGIHQEVVFGFMNPRGGHYFPGFWSMTTHQGFGARTPALPSGRLAGETLANGVSPCNGRDSLGPTVALASAAALDNTLVANGYAFNQKLNPENLRGAEGNAIVEGLVRGYFKMGGMQVQFNMVDPETLIEAKKNPEKYHGLVVRVSGYSSYFNDLTEEMKDELIARTLHFADGACC